MTLPRTSPIQDPKVNAVIARLIKAGHRPPQLPVLWAMLKNEPDPKAYSDYGFSISPKQGELIYLLCRSIRATRVVEFATSVGMSALYSATAVRDNGGGLVIGSELVPEKVAIARQNLAEAGLAELVDIRQGDARETLRDVQGPIDFVLIDGWPGGEGPSLARQVLEIVAPKIRNGGLVMNDNGEADYLAYIHNPANGFLSMSLPLKGSTELSVKVGV